MNTWILTDDGTGQHVRKVAERRYEIIDSVCFPDDFGFVSRRLIDLDGYEMDDDFNRAYLVPYGYENEEAVRELYGGAADQIIVECIAETEIWERHNIVFTGAHNACREYIREVVSGKEPICE